MIPTTLEPFSYQITTMVRSTKPILVVLVGRNKPIKATIAPNVCVHIWIYMYSCTRNKLLLIQYQEPDSTRIIWHQTIVIQIQHSVIHHQNSTGLIKELEWFNKELEWSNKELEWSNKELEWSNKGTFRVKLAALGQGSLPLFRGVRLFWLNSCD